MELDDYKKEISRKVEEEMRSKHPQEEFRSSAGMKR